MIQHNYSSASPGWQEEMSLPVKHPRKQRVQLFSFDPPGVLLDPYTPLLKWVLGILSRTLVFAQIGFSYLNSGLQ